MLNEMQSVFNQTTTQNGANAFLSTLHPCLDFFSVSGALRNAPQERIIQIFERAYCATPDLAMRALFYTRDIRGGIGERRVFRVLLWWLAKNHPDTVIKNIGNVFEYGRFDDLFVLFDTPCENALLDYIKKTLQADEEAMQRGESVSLLAKWLPSLGASDPLKKRKAKRLAKILGISEKTYRKRLSALRGYIHVLERYLCNKDYSFDYEKQPSKALYKYSKAFIRNDGKRYGDFLMKVKKGECVLKTGSLYPYEIIRNAINPNLSSREIFALDMTWRSLPDYGDNRNAIAVIDGSGSMEGMPIAIATSLGIYFAEHNQGYFRDHFITFSERPRLVKIHGNNIAEKAEYCMSFNEVANTDLMRVYALILQTAILNNLPQSELPETIYVISDMEFDTGVCDNMSLHHEAKATYEKYGYKLPTIVYWNVDSKSEQQPVTADEIGTVLVSGASPSVFGMVISQDVSPLSYMMQVLEQERYARICA